MRLFGDRIRRQHNTTLNISGGQGGYANTIAVDPVDVDRVIVCGIRV